MSDEKRGKLGDVIEVRVSKRRKPAASAAKPDDRRYGLYPILDEIPRPQRDFPCLLTDEFLYNIKSPGNPTNRKDLSYSVEHKTISGSKSAWFDAVGNLKITENKKPQRIKLLGTLAAYPANFFFPSILDFMARNGDVLVIPEFGTSHLTLVDVSDPTTPAILSRTDLDGSLFSVNQRGSINNAVAFEDVAYVYNQDTLTVPFLKHNAYLASYDISNPASINQIASFLVYIGSGFSSTDPNNPYVALSRNGSIIYLGRNPSGVNPEIVVLNGAALSVVTTVSIATTGSVVCLFYSNNRLYAILNPPTGNAKLYIYDVGSPTSPALTGSITLQGGGIPAMYATEDGIAYISLRGFLGVGDDRIEVIDATVPQSIGLKIQNFFPSLLTALSAKGRAL